MSDPHSLVGAYAVDALDDLERAGFERHLAHCPDCAAELAGLREAAAMLAHRVPAQPPDAMRARVLARIATVRPLPPTAPATPAVRRTARRLPRLLVAVAAALVLIAGAGVAVWHPWTEHAPVAVSVAERVMDAPDARTQSISFPDGSRATLYHSRSVDRAVLVTHKMAPAPTGKVYELWFQDRSGTMVPAGLMDSGGNQTVVLHGKLAGAKGVGITVEPGSGSPQPTSAPVALFDLRKAV